MMSSGLTWTWNLSP